MAKKKVEAAIKMQTDVEAVKAGEPLPEEASGEPGAVKEEDPPEEKPTEESEAEKAGEPLPEEASGEPVAVKEEDPPEEKPTGNSGAEKAEEPSPEEASGEPVAVKEADPPEEKPTGGPGAEKAEEPSPEEKLSGESGAGSPTVYKIVCRNKITKQIGGVDFMDGEGYTSDGYAASWFAGKDGYTVESAELGQLW